MRQTPDRGYILPIWEDKNAYRATADAYMTREGVEEISNQDGNTYTREEVKNSMIRYNSGASSEEIRQEMKTYQAEERKRKAAKAIEEAKEMEVKIQEWIAGERQSLYPRPKIDLLRIVGESGWEMVETSQGVKMHIYEAKAIYLQLVRHELKAGDQVLDRYTVSKVNGTVNIGCHTFDTEYLLNFGKSL